MSEDKAYFPKGFFYNKPHDNAPDFVMGKASIKVKEFSEYLSKVKGDTLNLDLKISRDGKGYAQVDTWKPDPNRDIKPPVNEPVNFDDDSDGLPF